MRMRSIGAAMLGVLALAGPAAGQMRTRMHSEVIDDGRRMTIDVNGELRFGDDDQLAYVGPGGRLVMEEERPGAPDRRVEYRDDGGGVRRRFFRDGRETAPGEGDEAWIRAAMLELVRESGVNAEARVARIYRRGGTAAVLEETRRISSDGAKRAYFTALLRQPGLRPGDTAEALEEAGRRIASDGDKRSVLATLLERPAIRAEEMAAMLEASARIASDGDKSSLLVRAAARDPLADAAVREAFFAATRRIASDGDKSRVLIAALTRSGARRDVVVAAIRTARSIASDGDKSRVLMSVPAAHLGDGEVRAALLDTMRGIASDGDRSRVAIWLARSQP
ncbi:hypothetical protein [Longimicrobium sp.]|uniref:hypothetical protein n=1 Tax=Longimicrobium sp. TaxID=2029185 RepID=UPI002C5573A3|nr:hypothetical protein [Longimicrobium sp.]HSU15787.1 hypothetical protein [Longimicrobium sp.]